MDWQWTERDPLEESGTLINTPPSSLDRADVFSVSRDELKLKNAASVIQRAWRLSQSNKTRKTPQRSMSLRDYKDKITVIQKTWRQRKELKDGRSNTIQALVSSGIRHWPQATLGYPTPEPEAPVRPVEAVEQREHHIASVLTSSIQIQTDIEPVARAKIRLHPVKFPPSIVDEWHANMLPRLERLIERALKESDETISIDLVAIGDTQATARPTVLVTCSSIAKVKTLLDRRFRYDKTIFDLKVRRGKVRRSKMNRSSRRRRLPHRSMMNTDSI